MPDRGGDLRKLFDGVPDLLVEHAPIRDNDNRAEDFLAPLVQSDKLMSEPGDRIALAAACGMLYEVAAPSSASTRIAEEFSHDIELVVARKDLLPLLTPGSLFFSSTIWA